MPTADEDEITWKVVEEISIKAAGLLLPVFVRQRLVCVAYCDRSSLGLAELDLPVIERLGSKAAIAFERCILRRKLQST